MKMKEVVGHDIRVHFELEDELKHKTEDLGHRSQRRQQAQGNEQIDDLCQSIDDEQNCTRDFTKCKELANYEDRQGAYAFDQVDSQELSSIRAATVEDGSCLNKEAFLLEVDHDQSDTSHDKNYEGKVNSSIEWSRLDVINFLLD